MLRESLDRDENVWVGETETSFIMNYPKNELSCERLGCCVCMKGLKHGGRRRAPAVKSISFNAAVPWRETQSIVELLKCSNS